MTKKRFGCLIAALVVVLGLSLMMNLAFIGSRANLKPTAALDRMPRFVETRVAHGGSTSDKIVLLHLRGLISSSISGVLGETMVDDFKLALRQALRDDNVKGIVLHIDSPGGEVTASDAMYHALTEAREKKPVLIHMGSLATSGGYYVACGGSHVMAHETSLTGSIGVIIQTLNYQELFGKIGLEAVVFKSGRFKDILSGAREMSPTERAMIQELVMEMYDRFVGIVAKERGLDEAVLRESIADGRILSGRNAVEAGLANDLGYLEDAYAKARELAGAPDAEIVRYDAPFSLGKIFRFLGESRTGSKVELALPGNPTSLESGRIYLLPAHYAP